MNITNWIYILQFGFAFRNTNHFKLNKPEKIKKLPNNMQFEIYDELQIKRDSSGKILTQYIKTTPGRILLNEIIASAIKSKTFN